MSERFKIIDRENPNPDQPKTFVIKSNSDNPPKEKAFRIKSSTAPEQRPSPETNQATEWFRQSITNNNDCGPCLLLNSSRALELENTPNNITEMRNEVNRARREANMRELNPTGWFTTNDLGGYFIRHGFSVQEYSGDPDDTESQESILKAVDENIREPFKLICTTFPDSHYRGIIPSEEQGHYLLLDSFRDGPQKITTEQANTIIFNTLSAPKRPNGQLESLQIIRRKSRTP